MCGDQGSRCGGVNIIIRVWILSTLQHRRSHRCWLWLRTAGKHRWPTSRTFFLCSCSSSNSSFSSSKQPSQNGSLGKIVFHCFYDQRSCPVMFPKQNITSYYTEFLLRITVSQSLTLDKKTQTVMELEMPVMRMQMEMESQTCRFIKKETIQMFGQKSDSFFMSLQLRIYIKKILFKGQLCAGA